MHPLNILALSTLPANRFSEKITNLELSRLEKKEEGYWVEIKGYSLCAVNHDETSLTSLANTPNGQCIATKLHTQARGQSGGQTFLPKKLNEVCDM